jgi:hypothetical protein
MGGASKRSKRRETILKTRRGWVDNVKMDLGEIGWGGVNWIGLALDRDQWSILVNAIMNIRIP